MTLKNSSTHSSEVSFHEEGMSKLAALALYRDGTLDTCSRYLLRAQTITWPFW